MTSGVGSAAAAHDRHPDPALVNLHPALVDLHPALVDLHPALVDLHPALVDLHPALVDGCRSGADVGQTMPVLCTDLGHVTINSISWYLLSAARELLGSPVIAWSISLRGREGAPCRNAGTPAGRVLNRSVERAVVDFVAPSELDARLAAPDPRTWALAKTAPTDPHETIQAAIDSWSSCSPGCRWTPDAGEIGPRGPGDERGHRCHLRRPDGTRTERHAVSGLDEVIGW